MPPRASYFICAAPRTGSTLLGDTLLDTRIAGTPKEYFDQNFEQLWIERFGTSTESEYVDKVLEVGTTPNGVFGMKVFWFQLEFLLAKLGRVFGEAKPDFGLLDRVFPNLRYIFVVRKDKVRQAISYLKADQTQMWWSIPDAPGNRTAPQREPSFDFAEIDRRVKLLSNLESSWCRYFEKRNIQPLTLEYEDFNQAIGPAIESVLRYLEIPIPDDFAAPKPRLLKQADALSEEWVSRYHELKQAEAEAPSQAPVPAETQTQPEPISAPLESTS